MSKVKIDLVTGFLGAGKTTFILRLLPWLKSRGIRAAVVENDFARTGMDSALIAAAGGQVCELAGGCICCGLKANFHDLLLSLAESGQCDRIIVEPSGIFDPRDFFQVAQSPRIREVARVGAVVALIDPAALKSVTGRSAQLLCAQLTAATAVVAGRPVEQEDFARQVAAFAAGWGCPPVACPVPARGEEELFEQLLTMEAPTPPPVGEAFDHQAVYRAAAFRVHAPLCRERLAAALAGLFDGSCGQVLRVKGTVNTLAGPLRVNAAPQGIGLEPAPAGEAPVLNVIGRDLNRAAIKTALESCREGE